MTRTNVVLFVVIALVLCVLLELKASLRRAALTPPATKATTIIPVKPDAKMVPAPAVSVPLAIEPQNLTVVPVKPAPVVSSQPTPTARPRPDAGLAPRAGGKGSPDGQ